MAAALMVVSIIGSFDPISFIASSFSARLLLFSKIGGPVFLCLLAVFLRRVAPSRVVYGECRMGHAHR
jgi:hypothetical protein